MVNPNCIFCQIVSGEAPATIVARWSDAIAILPLNPVTAGHLLVIPRAHVADALVDRLTTAVTMARAAQIATAPCNLITSVGEEATQSIFHLHIHVVPRRADDNLPLPWTPQQSQGLPYCPHCGARVADWGHDDTCPRPMDVHQ